MGLAGGVLRPGDLVYRRRTLNLRADQTTRLVWEDPLSQRFHPLEDADEEAVPGGPGRMRVEHLKSRLLKESYWPKERMMIPLPGRG